MSENQLAIQKNDIVDIVGERVQKLRNDGELDLPKNYSVGNALKSAWLKLQETKTKGKKPVLDACTKNSIANALLDMIVQGLNPGKEQCYFVAYGQKLICQRSYFGSMAMVKQVAGAEDVDAQAIFKGDEIDYEIENGRTYINEHTQKFENKLKGELVGAYATIKFEDERPDYTEILTINQLKQSWSQGQTYKENGNGTHQKFGEEMAKKTAVNRVCKSYINSSDDSHMIDIQEKVNKPGIVQAEQEAEQEIEKNANSEVIDIEESGPAPDEPMEKYKSQKDNVENDEQEQEKSKQETEPEPAMASTGTEGPDF